MPLPTTRTLVEVELQNAATITDLRNFLHMYENALEKAGQSETSHNDTFAFPVTLKVTFSATM